MQSEQLLECKSCGTRYLNLDVTVRCPRCRGEGKNITKMSSYNVLKALPATMNQFAVGSRIELSNAEVGTLVEDGYLELVGVKDETVAEATPADDSKKEDGASSDSSDVANAEQAPESNVTENSEQVTPPQDNEHVAEGAEKFSEEAKSE